MGSGRQTEEPNGDAKQAGHHDALQPKRSDKKDHRTPAADRDHAHGGDLGAQRNGSRFHPLSNEGAKQTAVDEIAIKTRRRTSKKGGGEEQKRGRRKHWQHHTDHRQDDEEAAQSEKGRPRHGGPGGGDTTFFPAVVSRSHAG